MVHIEQVLDDVETLPSRFRDATIALDAHDLRISEEESERRLEQVRKATESGTLNLRDLGLELATAQIPWTGRRIVRPAALDEDSGG